MIDPQIRIVTANCLDFLATLEPESVDACVTDTPYELGFMCKKWDSTGISYRIELWGAVLRVLKPGAYLLAFGGSRTHHRMVCAIEDAGFGIRDEISWLYGSGFPKSKNLPGGRGTALKPAQEPICVARKPFKGSLTECVSLHGTGAMNIDAARVPLVCGETKTGGFGNGKVGIGSTGQRSGIADGVEWQTKNHDRWPANVVTDGSDCVLDALREDAGDDVGRFFYCAKPSTSERESGLEDFAPMPTTDGRKKSIENPYLRGETERRNTHTTVKPVALMRWLCRLVTPLHGVVLDPFTGSGTTACAAAHEGFRFVGCDLVDEHVRIALARATEAVGPLFAGNEIAK